MNRFTLRLKPPCIIDPLAFNVLLWHGLEQAILLFTVEMPLFSPQGFVFVSSPSLYNA